MEIYSFHGLDSVWQWLLNDDAAGPLRRRIEWQEEAAVEAAINSDREATNRHGWVRQKREPVLVVLYPDGACNVYAGPGCWCKVVNLPLVHSVEAELLVEGELDRQLPEQFAELHVPSHPAATGQVEAITVGVLEQRQLERELHKAAKGATALLQGKEKARGK